MPQLYDNSPYDKPPKPNDKEAINERVKLIDQRLAEYLPETAAHLVTRSAIPRRKFGNLATTLDESLSWVNETESLGGQPGALFQARVTALREKDPKVRAMQLDFLKKLQALPYAHQEQAITYIMQGAQGLENQGLPQATAATERTAPVLTAGQVEATVESLDALNQIDVNDGRLSVPHDANTALYDGLQRMFPGADLFVEDPRAAQTSLEIMSNGLTDYAWENSSALREGAEFLEEEVSGKGLGAVNFGNVKSLLYHGGGSALQLGASITGDATRAAHKGIHAQNEQHMAEASQAFGEFASRKMMDGSLSALGWDYVDPDDPRFEEIQVERAENANLALMILPGAAGSLLAKAGRGVKLVRSVAGTVDDVAAVQAAARSVPLSVSGKSGALDKVLEGVRAPLRAGQKAFDDQLLRFARDPEQFFIGAINGRGGRKLLNVLEEAKKAHPNNPQGQLGFVREVYGTGVHSKLVTKMLRASSPEEAKHIFIQTTTSKGGSVNLNANSARRTQVAKDMTRLEKELDGIDQTTLVSRARGGADEIDNARVERLTNELARLRVEDAHLQHISDTMFDDNPMFRYPEQKFVRSVVRQPTTPLQRRAHALVVRRNGSFLDPAKTVDDLPKRPQLFVHGIDGNPADFLDQNTAQISHYMRRAGVDAKTIQQRIGELAEATDQQSFFDLVEHKIFGKGGDIDKVITDSKIAGLTNKTEAVRAAISAAKAAGKSTTRLEYRLNRLKKNIEGRQLPDDIREKLINLHDRTIESRARSMVTETIEGRGGKRVVAHALLEKRSADGETVPLPSTHSEFLQNVALPDVDALIEASSQIRRAVRRLEHAGAGGAAVAKGAWRVPAFIQHVSTLIMKPSVMVVRMPAMGMRIQLEQALRMMASGYKPFKGFPDGLSLLPGGIPVPGTNVRLLQGLFGEDGWRLLDPDPELKGISGNAANSELGMFMEEVGETKAMDYDMESTVEFRAGTRSPKGRHWEANREPLARAHADPIDRQIAREGMNVRSILDWLQKNTWARNFMESRMDDQLRASTMWGHAGELDGKVIQMPASELAKYVEYPERLGNAGRDPIKNAEVEASIQARGYDPDYIDELGSRQGNVILEVNPATGKAVIRERHHRIGAASRADQNMPVEIKVVHDTNGVRGTNIDEVADDPFLDELGALSESSDSGIYDAGKDIDVDGLLGSDYTGSETDLLQAARKQWVEARVKRMEEITHGNPDHLEAVAKGSLPGRGGGKTLDPDGRPYALDYNTARRDYEEVGEEIRGRVNSGVLVNGSDADRAQLGVLQEQQRDIITHIKELEAGHPDLTAGQSRVKLTDKRAVRSELKRGWEAGEWEMPKKLQVAKRRGPEEDLGMLGDLENFFQGASGAIYKGLRPLTYVDRHGTRGSLYTQAYGRNLREAKSRGYDGEAAAAYAHVKASATTRDLMYDLNARTSVQRALKDIFWFAPATQEVLYTWLVKIPAQSYWPVGAAALGGKAVGLVAALEGMGIVTTNAQNEKVIRIPGLSPLLDLLPGDQGDLYTYGKLEGLNLVTTGGGVPGLSTSGNYAVGWAAKKWGGPFKVMSDIFQPYGPEASILPMPITYLHEAVFGEAPPWEFLSPDYQKAQWDKSVDAGIQYAYVEMSEEGTLPPKPEDFGTFDQESGTWDLTAENEEAYRAASKEYLFELFDRGKNIAQGNAWAKLLGSTVAPMSLYTSSEEKDQWTEFWNDVVVPEGFSQGISDEQSNLINSFLEDHPNSVGFATFTTMSGNVERELPFGESLDDAWYDAYYTGEKRTATPQEFALKVMASESRRHYQTQLDTQLNKISPDNDPWELLTQGHDRNRALSIYKENWDRYRFLNPELDAQLTEQAYIYAINNDVTLRTFEAERIGDAQALMKQVAPMLTGESGIRPTELRSVMGQLAELYSEEGEFGAATDKTGKAMDWWYTNVMNPYLDQTATHYEEIERLTELGLDASHVYDQIRTLSNAEPPSYQGEAVPSAESVFFGNRTPEEQAAAINGWISRPVTWLSDFQREKAGYIMAPSTTEYLNKLAKYDEAFYDYIEENGIQSSSKEYDDLFAQRTATLRAEAEKVGPEALKYMELNEAQPYVRMNDSGYGASVSNWGNASEGAAYVVGQLEALELSPRGFSVEAMQLKSWFYQTVENARDSDPAFDTLLNELKYSFSLPGGGYRDGVVLYEAVFFGNFSERDIPESLAQLGA